MTQFISCRWVWSHIHGAIFGNVWWRTLWEWLAAHIHYVGMIHRLMYRFEKYIWKKFGQPINRGPAQTYICFVLWLFKPRNVSLLLWTQCVLYWFRNTFWTSWCKPEIATGCGNQFIWVVIADTMANNAYHRNIQCELRRRCGHACAKLVSFSLRLSIFNGFKALVDIRGLFSEWPPKSYPKWPPKSHVSSYSMTYFMTS